MNDYGSRTNIDACIPEASRIYTGRWYKEISGIVNFICQVGIEKADIHRVSGEITCFLLLLSRFADRLQSQSRRYGYRREFHASTPLVAKFEPGLLSRLWPIEDERRSVDRRHAIAAVVPRRGTGPRRERRPHRGHRWLTSVKWSAATTSIRRLMAVAGRRHGHRSTASVRTTLDQQSCLQRAPLSIRSTPAAAMSAQAFATLPPTSMPRTASATMNVSNPSRRASIAVHPAQ